MYSGCPRETTFRDFEDKLLKFKPDRFSVKRVQATGEPRLTLDH